MSDTPEEPIRAQSGARPIINVPGVRRNRTHESETEVALRRLREQDSAPDAEEEAP